MTDVFISFASRFNRGPNSFDGHIAQFFEDRFEAEGISFYKFDSQSGALPPGEWKKRIPSAIQESSVLLVVLSDEWLESDICQTEFHHADQKNKTIIPIRHEDLALSVEFGAPIYKYTVYDLSVRGDLRIDESIFAKSVEGISYNRRRLAAIISEIKDKRAGGTPPAWPDERRELHSLVDPSIIRSELDTPLTGLNPFYEWQGGVFFGREPEINRIQGILREMKVNVEGGRVLPVTGPSGVGKSSFLRAGVVSRLADVPGVMMIPVVNPKAGRDTQHPDDLYNRFEILRREAELQTGRRFPAYRDHIKNNDPAFANIVVEMADALHRHRYDRPAEMILVPVDQGEELFEADRLHRAGVSMTIDHETERHGHAVLQSLTTLHFQDKRVCSLIAIRSDFESDINRSEELRGVSKRTAFPLPTISPTEYPTLIRSSLESAGFRVTEDAVRRIARDISLYNGRGDPLALLSLVLKYVGETASRAQRRTIEADNLRSVPEDTPLVARSVGTLTKKATSRYRVFLQTPDGRSGTSPQYTDDQIEEQLAEFIAAWFVHFDDESQRPRSRNVVTDHFNAAEKKLISGLANDRILRIQKVNDTQSEQPDPAAFGGDAISAEIMHEVLFSAWPKLSGTIKERQRVLSAKTTFIRLQEAHIAGGEPPRLSDLQIELARELVSHQSMFKTLPSQVREFVHAGILRAEQEAEAQSQQMADLRMVHASEIDTLNAKLKQANLEQTTATHTAEKLAHQVRPTRTVAGVLAAVAVAVSIFGYSQYRQGETARALAVSLETDSGLVALLQEQIKAARNGDEEFFQSLAQGTSEASQFLQDNETASDGIRQAAIEAEELLATRSRVLRSWQTNCTSSDYSGASIEPDLSIWLWCGESFYRFAVGTDLSDEPLSVGGQISKAVSFSSDRILFQRHSDPAGVYVLSADGHVQNAVNHRSAIVSMASDGQYAAVVSNDYTGSLIGVNLDSLDGSLRRTTLRGVGSVPRGVRPRQIRIWSSRGLLISENDQDIVQLWQITGSTVIPVDTSFTLGGGVSAGAIVSLPGGRESSERYVLGSESGDLVVVSAAGRIDVSGPAHKASIKSVGYAAGSERYFAIDAAGAYSIWRARGVNEQLGILGINPNGDLKSDPTGRWWAGSDVSGRGFLIHETDQGELELVRRLSPNHGHVEAVVSGSNDFVWLFRNGGTVTAVRTPLSTNS